MRFEAQCEEDDSLEFLRMKPWVGKPGLTAPTTEIVGAVRGIHIRYSCACLYFIQSSA
jgi:hypothetical protein